MTNEQKEKLDAIFNDLRDTGHSIVAVVASYDDEDAHFSTRLSLTAVHECGVTEDHVVLDALREIATNWSEAAHS